MFWTKCNKILVDDNGYIVNCPSSPCGYYSVFGIKYRWLNSDTMQPSNKCSWSYHVFPAQVKDSKIQWNYMYSVCIQVSQNKGLVAKKKIRSGCWEDCMQWDQNWQNCLQWGQYCDFCVQIQVYNLAGCFDDYQKFAAFFYGVCGTEPDSNGKYPDIFEEYYGSIYPTGTAQTCIDNYWNKLFTDQYMLNYKINIKHMNQYWILWSNYSEYQYETYCDCYCDGSWEMPDENGNCPDGCTKQCYDIGGQPINIGAYGDQNTAEHGHGTIVRSKFEVAVSQSELGEKQSLYDCCRVNAARGKIGAINAFMMENVNTKDSYTLGSTDSTTCTNSNSLCKNFEYSSGPYDNFYGSMDQVKFHVQWRKILLERTAETPSDAKGIKFQMTLRNKKYDSGYSPEVVYSDETTSSIIEIMFDQEYIDLPLANHINHGMSFLSVTPCKIEDGYCNQDWESEIQTRNSPHVTWWYQDYYDNNVLRHYIKVDLTAVQYIK